LDVMIVFDARQIKAKTHGMETFEIVNDRTERGPSSVGVAFRSVV
jgi:hypothetical protein